MNNDLKHTANIPKIFYSDLIPIETFTLTEDKADRCTNKQRLKEAAVQVLAKISQGRKLKC